MITLYMRLPDLSLNSLVTTKLKTLSLLYTTLYSGLVGVRSIKSTLITYKVHHLARRIQTVSNGKMVGTTQLVVHTT